MDTHSAHHGPLDQFMVAPVFPMPQLFGVDISLTNSALVMLLSVAAVAWFFWAAARKRALVPGRLQSLGEVAYEFVHNLVLENAGPQGLRYFPFLLTLFIFILAMNVLGLVPFSFAPTSHIIVTFAMGAFCFTAVTLIGLIHQGPVGFLSHFVPPGIPLAIAPVIFLIELVSYLARPVSLGLRLAANMIAGHTLIHVMAGFVAPLAALTVLASAMPVVFLVFMMGLELFVALLQAYIFALLCSMYLGEALAEHHH